MTKSVLIVGAGPAGLVGAKTLKENGFAVSVYEAADRVGGMWRDERGGPGDKCSPDMHTNLSRFTVAFPDLSWASVDLSGDLPMFPKAWQVGRYLETYAEKFELTPHISLRRRVVRACLEEDQTWEVDSEDGSNRLETGTFDHLIVASGYFDKPAYSFDPTLSKELSNIQHSSRFRGLSGLTSTPGKVVVIGGSISGSEAAAQAAFQISDAQYAPSATKPVHAASKVYHVIGRPFYCLPRYLPVNPRNADGKFGLAPTFLPLDLVLYNLSRRGEGKVSATITTVSPDKAQKGHEFLRDVLGGDQRDIGYSELVYKSHQTVYPGYVGITDTYLEFVRSGIIVPVQGRVEEVKEQENGDLLNISLKQSLPWADKGATVSSNSHINDLEATNNSQGSSTIDDVIGIIEATGYKTSLDWLDGSVQEMLDYDPLSPNLRVPLSLSRGSILNPRIPTLGFIGFYEGPYWGIMAMQARFLADTWSESDPVAKAHLPYREICKLDTTNAMQQAIKNKSLQVPQFWMGDYVGLMEELARHADVLRDDSAFAGQQAGPIFPARYHSHTQASQVVAEVAEVIRASQEDVRFVAAAAFTGMQGAWTIYRNIYGDIMHHGTFRGTAHFHPREPTDSAFDKEYLYIEEGTIAMLNGFTSTATRRYVYRYSSTKDQITAWFVSDEDNTSTGALFNSWEFYNLHDEEHGWMARGEHFCDPDTYKCTCDFWFKGASGEGVCT
jgi:hypothetical protein